ncbi:hypothetical protein U1Q18_051115 [Sarracenia purpurea var. burkii]
MVEKFCGEEAKEKCHRVRYDFRRLLHLRILPLLLWGIDSPVRWNAIFGSVLPARRLYALEKDDIINPTNAAAAIRLTINTHFAAEQFSVKTPALFSRSIESAAYRRGFSAAETDAAAGFLVGIFGRSESVYKRCTLREKLFRFRRLSIDRTAASSCFATDRDQRYTKRDISLASYRYYPYISGNYRRPGVLRYRKK